MNITIELIVSFASIAGAMIGVWVNLNNKITKLETKQDEYDKQGQDIKEIKNTMQEIKVTMAKIETWIELSKNATP